MMENRKTRMYEREEFPPVRLLSSVAVVSLSLVFLFLMPELLCGTEASLSFLPKLPPLEPCFPSFSRKPTIVHSKGKGTKKGYFQLKTTVKSNRTQDHL